MLQAQASLTPSNCPWPPRAVAPDQTQWIHLRPTTDCRYQGWSDKRFFRFKRNPYLWTAVKRHHLNDITHQRVMRFNQWSNFANISIFKIPNASGHSCDLSTFCRTCPSWHNGTLLGPHVLNGYRSMNSAQTNTIYGTCDPALVDIWRTSHENKKHQSSLHRRIITGGSEKAARVSQRMGRRIGMIEFCVSVNIEK